MEQLRETGAVGPPVPGYPVQPGRFDECFTAGGEPRPEYGPLLAEIARLGSAELERRSSQSRKLLREHALTYDAQSGSTGRSAQRVLDPLPVLISAESWEGIARGLAQRAQLLDRVATDLHGKQELLRRRLLHPAVVHGSRHFLRPVFGLRPVRAARRLQLTAHDLVRTPDGGFRVARDHSATPTGLGYVLEHRLVASRTVPDLLQTVAVRSQRTFFVRLHNSLLRASPRRREDPRIVLLSPGSRSHAYFEHAYLAEHLGYPLVEPEDLSVRGDRVFLKTLDALEPVDVIFRHLDGSACDPLAFSPGGASGIPGLLSAVRAGNVSLSNFLGSNLVSIPAINASLATLCERLLEEELLLPSAPSWWCGDPGSLEIVLARLGELEVLPALDTQAAPVFVPAHSDAGTLDALRSEILARPWNYAAREPLVAATAPLYREGRLVPCEMHLRVFATASGREYHALPGGLARLFGRDGHSTAKLEAWKDVWVIDRGGDAAPPRIAITRHVETLRRGEELLSRTAENLYWLGRYQERAESLLRVVRAALRLLNEDNPAQNDVEVAFLASILEEIDGAPRDAPLEDWLLGLLFESAGGKGFVASLRHVLRLSSAVRDRLSKDTWRVLGRLEEELTRPPPDDSIPLADALESCEEIVTSLSALGGLLVRSMTRSVSWQFMDSGFRVEKALHMVNTLRPITAPSFVEDSGVLSTLLDVADSSLTYRMRYRATLQLAPVLDLLLRDETNPHSIGFQLVEVHGHIGAIGQGSAAIDRPEEKEILRALTEVRLADPWRLAEADPSGARLRLGELLDLVEKGLLAISDHLTERYLSHVVTPRHLGAREGAGRESGSSAAEESRAREPRRGTPR